MRFECSQQALANALGVISSLVEREGAGGPDVLKTLRIEAHEGYVDVKATDYDVLARTRIDASVAEKGAAHISGHSFAALVARLNKSKPVGVSVLDVEMEIKSGSACARLPVFSAATFAEMRQDENAQVLSINAVDFRDALTAAIGFASTNEVQFNLGGVHLHERDGNLVVEGCSNQAALQWRLPASDCLVDAIVPAAAARIIAKLIGLAGDTETLTLHVGPTKIWAEIGGDATLCKLIDAGYPAIDGVIGEPGNDIIRFDTKAMTGALRRASVFLGKYTDYVLVDAANGQVIVRAESSDKPGHFEEIVGPHDGPPLFVAYGAKRLSDVLSKAKSETSSLRITDEASPAFVDLGMDNVRCIIMPHKRGQLDQRRAAA